MISKFGFPNVWFQTKIARDNYNSTTIILRPFWIPINQFVISIPKHSFCSTVCICMVIQIKLVVVVVDQEIKVPRSIDELSSRIRDRVKWSRKRFQGRREPVWLIVGLADFHFLHILKIARMTSMQWLHQHLFSKLTPSTHNLLQAVEWSKRKCAGSDPQVYGLATPLAFTSFSCLPLPVATDCKGRHKLKLEKVWPTFINNGEIFLLSSSYASWYNDSIATGAINLWPAQKWPKTAISEYQSKKFD